MSSYHLHLSTHAAKPKALPKPTAVQYQSLALVALLLVSISILWMNLPWVTGLWQFALFLLAGCMALTMPASARLGSSLGPILFAAAIPVWGVIQMALGKAAYNYASLLSVLAWTTIPACLLLGHIVLREHRRRDTFLGSLWFLAAVVTALELYQLLILGRYSVMPSGYPLMSSNLYAELAELLLPAVLATALRRGSNLWLGCALSALMLGTTIAAGARMGTALLLLEAILVPFALRKAAGYRTLTLRKHGLPLAGLLLAVVAIEGTSGLTSRLTEPNPMAGRAEVTQSALEMLHQHPVIGYGLGSFPVVYPQFAHLQTESFVNHVHDDYLEIAVEGGVIGLLLWIGVVTMNFAAVLRAPWAFGTLAILVHSSIDFPIYRLPIAALMALLLAAAGSRIPNKSQKGAE